MGRGWEQRKHLQNSRKCCVGDLSGVPHSQPSGTQALWTRGSLLASLTPASLPFQWSKVNPEPLSQGLSFSPGFTHLPRPQIVKEKTNTERMCLDNPGEEWLKEFPEQLRLLAGQTNIGLILTGKRALLQVQGLTCPLTLPQDTPPTACRRETGTEPTQPF